jgi:aquaporin Z
MVHALRTHWLEYLMEAAELGLFMVSAGLFGTLLEYPQSTVRLAVADAFLRRVIMGVAMGLTAVGIIYSPWGKTIGSAHEPRDDVDGKVAGWDAVFYIAAQFLGGLAGVLLVGVVLGDLFLQPPVSAVATTPGSLGVAAAFGAEVAIAFILMLVVLFFSNAPRVARYTGILVGLLLASYITLEAPISGMSMNPARTFASALSANDWPALWVYFTAPLLGMLAAAQGYLWLRGADRVFCAKLHHQNQRRCIFCSWRVTRPCHQAPKPVKVNEAQSEALASSLNE